MVPTQLEWKLALDNPSDYMHSDPFLSLAAAAAPALPLSAGHGLHYRLSSLPRQRWAVGGSVTEGDCVRESENVRCASFLALNE